MYDVIVEKALALKIGATSPNIPAWKREQHQHQLYCLYMNLESASLEDPDMPF